MSETKTVEKKSAPRKKPVMKKFGHKKIRMTHGPRKRFPKLRLPRNSSKKKHVVMVFHLINSFSDTARAECLNALTPYLPKAPSEGQKDSRRLVASLMKVMKKHTDKTK